MGDLVNRPAHYAAGGVECIDAIAAATEHLNGLDAVCTGNVIKYVWRWRLKNGLQDLQKARWYLDRLIAMETAAQLSAAGELDAYDKVERFALAQTEDSKHG